MEIIEVMKKRHSVRSYTERAIEPEKREALEALASEINRAEGLRIQCIFDEPKCFDSFMAHYGKFTGVRNYIALVGKKSPDLDEKLGYFGEKLVLAAQELGLNTCWVALTHGKSRAVVEKGEKLVCLISLGYGATQGVSHTNKARSELCAESECSPEWFLSGVEAAMLAPTAMNQQKFYFECDDGGRVSVKSGTGFYTKLDLGIVKNHFEAVTGRKPID